MIKVEYMDAYGFSVAVRGMRNPMNSWDKSDSYFFEGDPFVENFVVGEDDYDLMERLVKAGTDHSKFMRMINISMDITAPLYWWKEFDTYKVGTVANSCSTMHKIADKEFTIDDFSTEHLIKSSELGSDEMDIWQSSVQMMINTICHLNAYRNLYLKTKDKKYWWQMIQLLPSSYNQKRTVTMNYAVARNIYHARKNHKLDEWQRFCDILSALPCSNLITMEVDK